MKQMDTNQDGHVTRLEFLNYHLKQAGFVEEEAVDGQKIQEDFQVLRECKDPEQVMHLARRVFVSWTKTKMVTSSQLKLKISNP